MAVRFRIIKCIVLLMLVSSPPGFAGTSTIENGVLHIPRIDIRGFGATELTFKIEFEDEYHFTLLSAVQADTNTANSGVFYPDLQILELDKILVETGAAYAAILELSSQQIQPIFRLINATLLNSASQFSPATVALYREQCGDCHGWAGQGSGAPALIACDKCNDSRVLSDYILASMPLTQAEACAAACAELLADYIQIEFNSSNRTKAHSTGEFIQLLDTLQTLRRVSLQLLSRLPTAGELQLVKSGDTAGLRQAIDSMMHEDAFYNRLSEIFNDYFLTDKYLSRNGTESAIRLLDNNDFPRKRWFDNGDSDSDDSYQRLRQQTNDAIAREPLELINHIVRNDRPFTELITADYMMVNPYSAVSYGVQAKAKFRGINDLNEFVPVTVKNYPHAGILTSPMFLNRYPTTQTNRNRSRARVVFDLLLNTDILARQGVRPVSTGDINDSNPTLDNPDCVSCHALLDPVAAAFQNWDFRGRYRPVSVWHSQNSDMLPAGFNGRAMPLAGNSARSLQWLAEEIATDPRFPKAIMRMVVNGLTGKETLDAPGVDAEQAKLDAYIAERALFNDIQQQFVDDNFNLKTLIRELLMSSYWRAGGLAGAADVQMHENTGAMALLTPEQLDRKIETLLGFQWRRSMDNYFFEKDQSWSSQLGNRFHFIYGGIDSDSVTTRLTTPNGLMGAMQLLMANELACYAVPEDFLRAAPQRRLFPHVERSTSPFDQYSVTDETGLNLIRLNIQHLHKYLLAENLPLGSAELLSTEQVFLTTMEAGLEQIKNKQGDWRDTHLSWFCDRHKDLQGIELADDQVFFRDRDFLIRSWMAVLAYLLSDYRFFYQ